MSGRGGWFIILTASPRSSSSVLNPITAPSGKPPRRMWSSSWGMPVLSKGLGVRVAGSRASAVDGRITVVVVVAVVMLVVEGLAGEGGPAMVRL